MQAKDVMTTSVLTVKPDATVQEIARRLIEHRISGVPVVDDDNRIVGIVSEGDLMRRPETGTERHRSWWLQLLAAPDETVLGYIRTHGGHAEDVMSTDVISVEEHTDIGKVAQILERHRIKRVPVIQEGRLAGIVSRADLLHGLVARETARAPSSGDTDIRRAVEAALPETGAHYEFVRVVVSGGVVYLWGAVQSKEEKRAVRIAAENVPGVKAVRDELGVLPASVRSVMWAE